MDPKPAGCAIPALAWTKLSPLEESFVGDVPIKTLLTTKTGLKKIFFSSLPSPFRTPRKPPFFLSRLLFVCSLLSDHSMPQPLLKSCLELLLPDVPAEEKKKKKLLSDNSIFHCKARLEVGELGLSQVTNEYAVPN